MGTLATIEKFDIRTNKISILDVQMPNALWRFSSIKISITKILFIGGIERINKESDSVYCFDLDGDELRIEKLDKISWAGVIEYPIIVD